MREEAIFHFGPPNTVFSDNWTCFTAKNLSLYMSDHHIDWKRVLEYASISNGRAERLVWAPKEAAKKMVLDFGE